MPFRVLVLVYRKPGLTPAEFKQLYETSHVPLVQRLAGPDFPRSHKRWYIARDPVETEPETETAEGNTDNNSKNNDNTRFPARVLWGRQEDFPFDAVAELTFDNEAGWQRFVAKAREPEAARLLAEDEERFLDRGRLGIVVLGDVSETVRG
ncbi:EthD domain-containing protein [Thermoascus aurantiacus ATCC 26904]